MSEPEELFERYLRDGDVAAFGELYDRLAPELLALAVRFAPSVAEAEDLVQASFLALLERPRAFRRGERLAPYLVGILARQAGSARRRARRAVDPSRLDPRAVESPEGASEERELETELRAALERLPDTYREVLRLHLLEGRRAVEIALRLGRTPGTVATQLQRGLGLLRQALPRGLAGAGLAALLPRSEAAVRDAVLAKAREHAAPQAAASTTLASVGALLLSSKVLGVGIAVSLLSLSLWFFGPEPVTPGARALASERGSATTPTRVEREAPPSAQRSLASAASSAIPARIETAGPAGEGALTALVHVRGAAPRHLAELRVLAELPGGEQVSAAVDAAGSARLELGPLTQRASGTDEFLLLRALHPMYLDGRELLRRPGSRRDAPVEWELTVQPASVVSGRVILPPDADPGALLFEFQKESGESVLSFDGFGKAPCDEQGRFRIPVGGEGLHRLLVTSPTTLPAEAWCRLELLEELALPDLVLEPGTAEIRGSVEFPSVSQAPSFAQPVVEARRRDVPAEPPRERLVIDRANAGSMPELRGGPRPTFKRATLDERGRFALLGLEPGLWELEARGSADVPVLPARAPYVVEAPASGVVLWQDRCFLSVDVVDSHGPVAGARVTWSWEQGEHAGSKRTGTDANGRLRVVADRATDYALSVSAPGAEPVELRWSAAGRGVEDERRVDLGPSSASALELVLSPESRRLEAVLLRLVPVEDESKTRLFRAELAEGRYRFARLDPGVYRATVGLSKGAAVFFEEPVQPCELELRLEPGATTEAEITLRAGGRVRVAIDTGDEPPPDLWLPVELLGPDGPRPFTAVARLEAGQGFWRHPEQPGALHLAALNALEAALPPGAYRFRPTEDGWSLSPTDFEARAGETTTVELVARRR